VVSALVALGRAVVVVLLSAWLIELAGAALVVAGVYLAWGLAAALAAGGVALLLKAFEIESRSS
jgi:hypothetical protein